MNQDDKDIKYRFESSTFPVEYPKALKEYEEELNKHEECRDFDEIRLRLDELYIDPDAVETIENTSYYNWLTLFLNLRSQDLGMPYRFISPSCAGKNPRSKGFEGYKNPDNDILKTLTNGPKVDESKILVYKTDEKYEILDKKPILRLTSDQLGFSAICGNHNSKNKNHFGENWEAFKNDKYPLHRYFGLTEGRDDAVNFLAQYIYDTRTLGGAFIWPTNDTEENGGRECIYNMHRGSNSYIEDRADLTLLEVKCYFEGIEKDDFRLKASKESGTYKFQMYKFLELFRCSNDGKENFKNFVKFFMFNSFVDENFTPIDITTGKAFKLNSKESPYDDNYKLLSEIDLDAESLMKILERVQEMVKQRTLDMEAILPS